MKGILGRIISLRPFAFDRGYALGREKETVAQEEIEKAVVDSFDQNPDAICAWGLTPKRVLNIIVKQGHKPINNNENE